MEKFVVYLSCDDTFAVSVHKSREEADVQATIIGGEVQEAQAFYARVLEAFKDADDGGYLIEGIE